MTVRRKLLILVYVPALTCTIVSLFISSMAIRKQGIDNLEDKSLSILNLNIQEYLIHHQDGTSILEIENEGNQLSEKDKTYKFRIASLDPENPVHTALTKDKAFIEQFQKEKAKQITFVDKETDSLLVMRPVFMEKSRGCMECHAVTKSGRHTKEDELRGIFVVTTSRVASKEKARTAIIQISAGGLIIIVIAVIIGILSVLKILSAVKQINAATKKMANGDLQQKVEIHTGDEFEELGSYINKMIDSLNKILSSVRNAAEDLAQSTKEISATSEEISQGAQSQANHFEELNNSFHLASENTIKASEFISQSVASARIAESGMAQTTEWMGKIKGSSEKIYEAVKIINSISFQTNMLALNAAVEASHAGINGRGFSVIASEVKKLSDITTNSSNEINEVTTNNLTQVEEGVKIAKEAGERIGEIMKTVSQIASMLREITAALKEQSMHIEGNLEVTRANSQASERLNESAVSLDDQANQLLEIVNYFKLKEN